MSPTLNSRPLRFEQFESRLCLAVTAAVASNGDLEVSGDSAGPVEIVALDSDSYQVTENGAVVASVDGVTRGIRIAFGSANDDVTLNLSNQTVAKDVRVELGAGDNSFTLIDGTIRGHLIVSAGDGIDTIDVQSDVAVAKNAKFELGAGDNVATFSGSFSGQFTLECGEWHRHRDNRCRRQRREARQSGTRRWQQCLLDGR